jgi:hypothetical protein
VEAAVDCGARLAACDLVVMRSVHDRYALTLDAIGSIAFRPGKPRTWAMIPRMNGFPKRSFTWECLVCPFRAAPRPTLISYRCLTDEAGDMHAFAVYENGQTGIAVAILGQVWETGMRLDYSQWQRIAVTWDADENELRLFHEDGRASISAALARTKPSLEEARFPSALKTKCSIPGDGCLVIGQMQQRFRDPSSFADDCAYCGALMSMSLWNRTLSIQELSHHVEKGIGGDEPGLVAAWRFSQISGMQGEGWNLCSEFENVPILSGVDASGLKDVRELRICAGTNKAAVASRKTLEANSSSQIVVGFERAWSAVLGGCVSFTLEDCWSGEIAGDFTFDAVLAAAPKSISCNLIRFDGPWTLAIALDDARRLVLRVTVGDSPPVERHTSHTLPLGRLHLAVTRTGAVIRIAVNGRLTSEWSDPHLAGGLKGLLVVAGMGFLGRIGRIGIWSRSLAPDEMDGEDARKDLVFEWRPSPSCDSGLLIAPDPVATRIHLYLNGAKLETVPIQIPTLSDENPIFAVGEAEDVCVTGLRTLNGLPGTERQNEEELFAFSPPADSDQSPEPD